MRVLAAVPFATMTVVYETDLEIIQAHVDRGDEVVVLACDADLPACFPNLPHELSLCMHCASRRREGLKLVSGVGTVDVRPLVHLSRADRTELSGLPTRFESVAQLRALTLESFDLGWGVLSSLVSGTRDPHPDLAKHADTVRRLVIAAASAYRSTQRHIDEVRPDRVYVFNGRFAVPRGVFRAALSRGVEVYTHERGATFRHYALYKNRLIHDPNYYQELVREFWAASDRESARILAASFFIDAAQGITHAQSPFVGAQQDGELPEGWDPRKNNIAVFLSSDDEFASIGDVWTNPLYADQYDALARINESLRGDDRVHVYVRMHPNQATMRDTGAVKALLGLREPHVTVLPPTSSVSTYAVMRSATRVLTFGSTTGVEATYWRKPSILANVSHYDKLGVTYNPGSHGEVIDLLQASGLPPKDLEGALMFGYFSRNWGHRFKYFQPLGLGGGPFRGHAVRPSMAVRIGARLLPFERAMRRVHLRLVETALSR